MTETLWRLTDPGDLAIDVGANIGYTTSILGVRVGPRGRVHSFEPHPQVFASLAENVERWKLDDRCGSFLLHQAALGKETGKAFLHTNDWFLTNRGTGWISEREESGSDVRDCEVLIQNLDSILDTKLGARMLLYSETLLPNSSASELGERTWDYPVRNFFGAFDERWPYGYGIGSW